MSVHYAESSRAALASDEARLRSTQGATLQAIDEALVSDYIDL